MEDITPKKVKEMIFSAPFGKQYFSRVQKEIEKLPEEKKTDAYEGLVTQIEKLRNENKIVEKLLNPSQNRFASFFNNLYEG